MENKELSAELAMIELLDKLMTAMKKYEKQTDRMVSGELEIIQEVIVARNETMEELTDIKSQLVTLVESQPTTERDMLRELFNGRTVNVPMTPTLTEIQLKVRSLNNTQQSILDKDKMISGRVREKFEDIRKELEELNKTKKKINYYNAAGYSGIGRSLDKNL